MKVLALILLASLVLEMNALYDPFKRTQMSQQTYIVNGQEVTADEYNQLLSGKPSSGGFQSSLQRKPSLMGSSTLGQQSIFGSRDPQKSGFGGGTTTYLVNGKPVSKDEFDRISAARKPGGGSSPSYPSYGSQTPSRQPSEPYGQQGSYQPKTPQGAKELSANTKKKVLDLHNTYRSELAMGNVRGQPKATQMTKLVWDEELAKIASKWAAGCTFKHANTEDYCGISGLPSVGENLGTGTLRRTEELLTQEEIGDKVLMHTKNWFNEHVDYNFNSLSCQPGKKCGHYTQVISDKSDRVGCGIAMCNGGVKGFTSDRAYLVACNYGPAGNIYGQKPYESRVTTCPINHPRREGIFCGGERTEAIKCVDTSSGCASWKSQGKCAMCHNPYYNSVTSQCPKTCGIC